MNKLTRAMDNFIPVTKIRIHQNDKPRITPTIKKFIVNDRQKSFFTYGKTSTEYKSCKYKTLSLLKANKAKYYQNKESQLKDSYPSKWWKEIKKLTGSQQNKENWQKQLEKKMGCDSPLDLANNINNFLVSLTEHLDPLIPINTQNSQDGPDWLLTGWVSFNLTH